MSTPTRLIFGSYLVVTPAAAFVLITGFLRLLDSEDSIGMLAGVCNFVIVVYGPPLLVLFLGVTVTVALRDLARSLS